MRSLAQLNRGDRELLGRKEGKVMEMDDIPAACDEEASRNDSLLRTKYLLSLLYYSLSTLALSMYLVLFSWNSEVVHSADTKLPCEAEVVRLVSDSEKSSSQPLTYFLSHHDPPSSHLDRIKSTMQVDEPFSPPPTHASQQESNPSTFTSSSTSLPLPSVSVPARSPSYSSQDSVPLVTITLSCKGASTFALSST